jgi:ubiquinone/menaquinone biosynthesis C-methylase UbiE
MMNFPQLARRLLSKLGRSSLAHAVQADHVRSGGVLIPAKYLRLGGSEFKDDKFFLASARAEAGRLVEHCGLSKECRVLDVGCGVGRLPIGILDHVGEIQCYWGVDVDNGSVRWCNRHIHRPHPMFQFQHIEVLNRRYNASGRPLDQSFRFDFDDQAFHTIYLYSVFSHMKTEDILVYLREFNRLLRPNGSIFLTAFIEEAVPNMSENPVGYRMNWHGALHCVRYEKAFFWALLEEAGFTVTRFVYAQETDGQSALYLSLGVGPIGDVDA